MWKINSGSKSISYCLYLGNDEIRADTRLYLPSDMYRDRAFISESTSGLLRYRKGQEEALKISKKKQTKENKFTQVDEKYNSYTSS